MNTHLEYFNRTGQHEQSLFELISPEILKHRFLKRQKKLSFLGFLNHLFDLPQEVRYSRYDHTISVAYLTLAYCKRLNFSREKTSVAILYALLHDIGHGPFSHSVETYHVIWNGFHLNHELQVKESKFSAFFRDTYKFLPITLRNQKSVSECAHLIYGLFSEQEDSLEIGRLFRYPISGDTLDGVTRACYSLANTAFDFNLPVIDPWTLADRIMKDGINIHGEMAAFPELEVFYGAEKRLYESVFYSPSVLAAEAMIVRALEIVYPQGVTLPYQRITDDQLVTKISANSRAESLWQLIKARDLFQPLESYDSELNAAWLYDYLRVRKPGNSFYPTRVDFERRLAKFLGIDPLHVIFHSFYPYSWNKSVDYWVQGRRYEQGQLFSEKAVAIPPKARMNRELRTVIFIRKSSQ